MAASLISEVAKLAPRTIKGTPYAVLVALADNASPDKRVTWSTDESIADRLRITVDEVKDAIASLYAHGIVEDYHFEEVPPVLQGRPIRLITTPDNWQ